MNSDPVDSPEEGGTLVKDESARLPVSKLDDPDMQAVPRRWSGRSGRAHWVAHQHGTTVLVVEENGEMVETDPDPALYEAYRAARSKRRSKFTSG